jgi:hypothetical protein
MKGPYARLYHGIVEDPMFERVYDNDHALATWVRLLLMADAMYPTSAPMPPRNPTVRLLIDCGLVIQRPGNRYSIRGLEAEGERRSEIGRYAAAVRYQRERSANAVPSKAEQSKEQQSNGANAPESTGVFMGMRPKASADAEDVRRQHEEDWTAKCADCGILKRKHSAGGEHPFRPELRSVS